MYVDASAIIAIIADEDERLTLSARLAQSSEIYVSPIVIYEAIAGLARKRACSIDDAEALVQSFVTEKRAQTIEITAAIGDAAVKALARFGKGRHKAALNMGDCFAYACAHALLVPLLFKGSDFVHTDIRLA